MDQEVVIVGTDGREHVFPPGFDPKRAAAIVSADAPRPPDSRVVAEQDRLDPETAFMRPHQGAIRQELDQAADDLPWALAGTAASVVLPGVLAKAFPYAPRAVHAVARVAGSPATGGAIGAAEGYRRGGIWGALTGGAAGYGLSKGLGALSGSGAGPDVAAGMSQSGRAAATADALSQTPTLKALMSGAGYDELSALPGVQAAAARSGRASAIVPRSAPTGASALEAELMARAKLAEPIHWRTTDVTPIRRPGPGIHFGEESTPGLLKMLQDALLAKNTPLAAQLQTAIRQRAHITGKVGEP